ncbi:MAG TPA: response regulator transcription factor [Thermoanaerobaculia bacterium]|nr:response regulator transcription factor [Thermoanaerobaculia bacterium]
MQKVRSAAALRPTVILADDHPMMLGGLRRLLEPELEVVGTARDGLALVEIGTRLRPDLVITDLSMPGIDGLEATRRLCAAVPGLRVLILSIHDEPSWVKAAFDAGACGYLAKTCVPEEIETAVRAVLDDRFYLSPTVARDTILPAAQGEPVLPKGFEQTPSVPGKTLTPRELDTLRLVGAGLGNKEIASRLGMSVSTVRTHLNSAYEKLGLENRVGLALYASHLEGEREKIPRGAEA